MKKKIDIEKALQWALREELPKGRAVSSSAWDTITNYGLIGTKVQTSGLADGLGFVPGTPHPDAEVIGQCNKRLERNVALDDAATARALLDVYAALDAGAVAALLAASFNEQGLVVRCAVLGQRPDWDQGAPAPEQMFVTYRNERRELRERALVHGVDKSGALVAISPKRTATSRSGYDLAMLPRSPLHWNNPPVMSIGHARAEYATWYGALVKLVDMLRDALTEFAVTLPAAVAEPWRTGQVASPTVRASENVAPLDKLPLAPKRPATPRPYESDIERKARLGKLDAARRKRAEKGKNEPLARVSGI